MMHRKGALCALVFAALASAAARADEPSGCAAFKWNIAQDQAALAAEARPVVEDGGALGFGIATAVRLKPTEKVHFRLPPDRAPKPDSFAAVIELPTPPAPGVYRLTLSDGAWIDAIQDGALLKPLAFSGAKDCPHVRKSLKFRFEEGKIALQISSAFSQSAGIVVVRE